MVCVCNVVCVCRVRCVYVYLLPRFVLAQVIYFLMTAMSAYHSECYANVQELSQRNRQHPFSNVYVAFPHIRSLVVAVVLDWIDSRHTGCMWTPLRMYEK